MSSFRFLFKMGSREIRHNWGQFLAIIGIGAIATTLFIGLQANAQSIEGRVNSFYSDGNLADVWVTTGKASATDLEEVIKPASEDDVKEYGSRYESFAQIKGHNFYCVCTPTLPTISKATELIDYTPDETNGHYFIIDNALTSSTSLSGGIFKVGNTLPIEFDLSAYGMATLAKTYLDPYVKEGQTNILALDKLTLNCTVSGTMKNPENITQSNYNTSLFFLSNSYFRDTFRDLLNENYSSGAVSLIFQVFKSQLGWGDGDPNGDSSSFPLANQYLLTLKDGADRSALEDKITKAFADKGTANNLSLISDRSSMPFAVTMQNDVNQAKSFCYVFPFVFFFTALLVILTTISQMVLKERLQIGTMKAIGLSKRQIYGHYIGISFTLVAIGTLIGEILGPLIIPSIMNAKYNILYVLPPLTYSFPVLVGILTAVVFLGVSALVTFLVCYKEVRLKPAESMRPEAPKMKAKNNKKTGTPSAHFLSVKMAFRNIILDPLKSLMVIFGVAGCTALLACGYGIGDTVDYGISHDLDMAASADVTVTMSLAKNKSDVISLFDTIEGVQSVEPYKRGSSTIKVPDKEGEMTSYVYVLSQETNSHFKVEGFSDNEVAASEKVTNKLGLKVGDDISFSIGSKSYTSTIGVIYQAFSYNGIIIRDTSKVFSEETVTFSNAWVDIKEGYSDDEVSASILKVNNVTDALTRTGWVSRIDDIVSGISLMTNAVKVFAILLALVVLYNLALLNFNERSRDIATLKVLGFSKKEIAASLLWETLSLTLVGVAIGLALGYPFLVLVMDQNIVDLVQYLFMIKPLSYVYSFLLTFVVALLVNLWLSFRTGQVKMVESLKSVE